MPRIMTIWLPRWPVQRRLLEHPAWRKVPLFVCRRQQRGVMTIVAWAWALPPRVQTDERAMHPSRHPFPVRIPEGVSLAEGMASLSLAHGSRACHIAEIDSDDPTADRDALEQVARWCRRFAPVVAVEDVLDQKNPRPECIHIDVTGTASFFGGEGPLVRTAVWTLAARGIHARAAIADTPGAAWAAAHHTDLLADRGQHLGQKNEAGGVNRGMANALSRTIRKSRWAVVAPGAQAATLGMLPAAALRVDTAVLSQLRDVGIDSIGGVLRLPKKSVASRFGPQLGMRLAQYAGTLAEPLAGPQGEGLPQATHAFDFPVSAQDAVEGVVDPILERLVKACVESLAAQGKGILAIQVRFERSRASEPTASCVPIVFDIGLFQPSASVEHVMGLVRLRMSRLRLPREIEGIAVEVGAAGPTCCRQRLLFGENVETSASQVGMLLDRLSGRLGRTAVFEPMPVAELQPEYAWVATPVARPYPPTDTPRKASSSHGHHAGTHDRTVRKDRNGWLFISAERRPIWMPPQPLRLGPVQAAMVSIIPDGPPVRFRLGSQTHQVTQAHGPERIETAWWRGPCVRRDYYVVETSTGARYWLFRRLRDGVWFLHGMFA